MKKILFPFLLNIQLFAEKEKSSEAEPQTAEEYAEFVKHLKETTVSKEEYDKVVEDKKTLAKALAEGGDVPEVEKQEKPNIDELRKKFLKAGETNLSNVEYVQTALELRKALIEKGEPDPFLPQGLKRKPDNSDYQGAERVAAFLEDCVEQSKDEEGKPDPDMFNALLKKGIANDSPVVSAKVKALNLKFHN